MKHLRISHVTIPNSGKDIIQPNNLNIKIFYNYFGLKIFDETI